MVQLIRKTSPLYWQTPKAQVVYSNGQSQAELERLHFQRVIRKAIWVWLLRRHPTQHTKYTHKGSKSSSHQSCALSLATSHAHCHLERRASSDRKTDHLPSIPHQNFLMEHSNSIWKRFHTSWLGRVLVMTLRLRLVFHMQLLPLPWYSLGESRYIFNIVPQMPHGWLKNGTVHPRQARRYTWDKTHPNEPRLPTTMLWNSCCFMEVQLTVDVCFT